MTKTTNPEQPKMRLRAHILGTSSIAGIAAMMLLGGGAVAQTQPAEDETPPATVEAATDTVVTEDEKREDVIIVRGIRSSLEKAIEVKRYSDNIVDGISAESIGRFPDLNLAESLQRVSGVQIVRDDFRSGQVAIRGIRGFSKTQVNGQDLASPNFGGAFVYSIFESSVLSGVDVMKTPLVSMDEGGIAGVVNLKTRGALDFEEDRHLFLSAKGQFEGLNEALIPDFGMSAGIKNAAGNMGVYVSLGYQEKDFRSDSAKITEYEAIDSTYNMAQFGEGPFGLTRGLSNSQLDALGGDLSGVTFVPKRARYTSRGTTGERLSIAGGAEWQVNDELSLKLTGIYAEDNNEQPLNTISLMTFGSRGFNFDILETQDEGALGTTATRIRVHSPQMQVQERIRDRDFQTWAATLDADWEKGPWSVHGALHYTAGETVQSQHQIVSRIESRSSASGNTFLDNGLVAELNTGGGDPYGFGFTLNRPFSDIGTFGWSATNTADPTDHLFAGIFTGSTNNYERSEDQFAAQFDVTRELDMPLVASVDLGAKFKSLGQENQEKRFHSIFNSVGTNRYDISAWDDSLFHDSFLDDGSGFFGGDVAFPGLLVPDARAALDAVVVNTGALVDDGISLDVIDPETGLVFDALGTGVHDNTQDITAFYAQANFDEKIPGLNIGLRGNIGIRYVHTDRSFFTSAVETVENFPGIADSRTRVDVEGGFDFDDVLPQINLIFDVTDDLVLRASYSETMNRLSPEAIRAGSNFSARLNSNGEAVVSRASDRSRLLPNTAKSFDIAGEWYNRAGSTVHGAVFTKNIENSVVIEGICADVASVPGIAPFVTGTPAYDGANANNGGLGDCRDDIGTIFNLTRRFNTGDTFRVSGAEFGFTQNLDFLEGWMSNFGVTANYTYLYKHTPQRDDSVSGSRFDTDGGFVGSSVLDQLSLSPHSFNLITYYETDKFGLRLAGNFRSNYVDGRTLGGFLGAERIVDDRVQWDFSGSYDVTDKLKLGAEIINIFDEDRYEYQGAERRHRNLFSEGRTMTISASYNF